VNDVREYPKDDVRQRLRTMIRRGAPGRRAPEVHDLMTDGCARMLTLETEKLQLGRRISELAVTAEDPTSAKELRRLWLRRTTLASELTELRSLLRQLSVGTSSTPV
jgi:hypothetical protein